MLRQTAVVFAATIAGSFFTFLFQFFMGRRLSVEAFGAFGSLFNGIFYYFILLAGGLQSTVARTIATMRSTGDEAGVDPLVASGCRRLAAGGLVIVVFFVAAARPIASFFHIGSVWPVVFLGFAVYIFILMLVAIGYLQGKQAYTQLGLWGTFLPNVLRFVFGAVLVAAGFGLAGAMGGVAASGVVTVAVVLAPLMLRAKGKAPKLPPGTVFYLLPAIGVAVVLGMPTSIDVLIIRHYFPGDESGVYNAGATMSKVIIFLPLAFSFVLFPQATHSYESGKSSKHILRRGAMYTALLSGAVTLGYLALPHLATHLFFGSKYAATASLIRWYGPAMAFFAVSFICLQYGLAVRHYWYIGAGLVWTAVEVLLLLAFHDPPVRAAQVLLVGNATFAVFSVLALLGGPDRVAMRPADSPDVPQS